MGGHIDQAYRVLDEWLGGLLEDVSEDTLVMVVSDHGMHASNLTKPKHPQSGGHEDSPDGVFILAGPGVQAQGLLTADARRVGDILDLTPTWLDFLGLPIGTAMKGHSLRALMTSAWQESHALLPRDADLGEGFRAATPALEPSTNANEQFLQGIKEMGYIGSD